MGRNVRQAVKAVEKMPKTLRPPRLPATHAYGGGSMGRRLTRGTFILDPHRLRIWMVPDLTGFTLQPLVPKALNAEASARKSSTDTKPTSTPEPEPVRRHSLADYFRDVDIPDTVRSVAVSLADDTDAVLRNAEKVRASAIAAMPRYSDRITDYYVPRAASRLSVHTVIRRKPSTPVPIGEQQVLLRDPSRDKPERDEPYTPQQ